MDSEKDTIEKIDEDIELLLSEEETIPEKKLQTTTKIFDQRERDKIESKVVSDTAEMEETSETKESLVHESSQMENTSPIVSDEVPMEDSVSVKSKKKKYWLIFVFVIFLVVGIIISIVIINYQKSDVIVVPIDDELLSKREQKIITDYGQMLEKVISDEYKISNKLLSYEEASNKIKLENEVICKEVEIYSDCTVYLNSCSINGKNTKHYYGVKREQEIPISSDTQIVVYENQSDHNLTLIKPDSIENYQYYVVSVTPGYHDVTFVGTKYLFYVDSNVIGNLVDFRTNRKALSKINYTDLALIRMQDQSFDSNVVAVLVNQKWNFFDLETSRRTHYSSYDAIGISLTNDTSGKSPYIETIQNNYMVVSTNQFTLSGIINYITGDEIVPLLYRRLGTIDDFVVAYKDDFIDIYSYEGKKQLESYDIYSILSKDLILVSKNQQLFVVNIQGQEYCMYDSFESTYEFSHGIMDNNVALFEFLDQKKKIQYTFDPASNKCVMKE